MKSEQPVCYRGPLLGQTDGQTLYRYVDPASHTVRAMPTVHIEVQTCGNGSIVQLSWC